MTWVNPAPCPAQQGNGIDIIEAAFTLLVENAIAEHDASPVTEISGYFRPCGEAFDDEDRLNDALVTAVVQVPRASVLACIAHQVNTDASGGLAEKIEDTLRANVALCPCTAQEDCPALNAPSLILALERAID